MLVAAGCPLPPVGPALAGALPLVVVIRVVVAGKRASVVLRPALPYTNSVAPGANTIVVPSTVMVPPGVSVWPEMTNVVPEPGIAVIV